jgi:hypothetical protein
MAPQKSLIQAPRNTAGVHTNVLIAWLLATVRPRLVGAVLWDKGWTEVAEELISVNNVRRALDNPPAQHRDI